MAVLQLVKARAEPLSVVVLRELLDLAMAGRLAGLSCSYRRCGAEEDHVTTGIYRDNPAEAIRAALKASIILTQLEESERRNP